MPHARRAHLNPTTRRGIRCGSFLRCSGMRRCADQRPLTACFRFGQGPIRMRARCGSRRLRIRCAMPVACMRTCARWTPPGVMRFWSRSLQRTASGPQCETVSFARTRPELPAQLAGVSAPEPRSQGRLLRCRGRGLQLKSPPWGCSSAGRASRSQCEGREFDPPQLHQHPRRPGQPGLLLSTPSTAI